MKIDFIAQIEGVEKTMPIIKASEYRHKWMIKMAQDYRKFGSFLLTFYRRPKFSKKRLKFSIMRPKFSIIFN